ncbi:MAG TPA: response regulator [Candidatus Wallbacteria bacterium]|nr:response regulator [Candidatus Wallbacteria bacterium]
MKFNFQKGFESVRSEKILIVDDAKFMRVALKRLFEKYGFEHILEAEDVDEALKVYSSKKPDFVTMDITMPGDSGLEGLKKIKEMDPSAKVLMVSAVSNKTNIVTAFELGAMYFLAKPFTDKAFDAVITKAFNFTGSEMPLKQAGPQSANTQPVKNMVLTADSGNIEIVISGGAVIGKCHECKDDAERGRNITKCSAEAEKKSFIPCGFMNLSEQQVNITCDNGNYFVTAIAESRFVTKLNLITISPGEKRLIRPGDVLTLSGVDFTFNAVK